MVYAVSGSIWQALLAAVIFQVICLKVADWTAPMMSEFFDLPGVSIATGSTISYAPGIYLVKLLKVLMFTLFQIHYYCHHFTIYYNKFILLSGCT
ncbi:hypothetical protein APW68_06765 [Staphylococcus aureus]|nr:hypothetical protein APW68_06765 [Staphylococcus aureus]